MSYITRNQLRDYRIRIDEVSLSGTQERLRKSLYSKKIFLSHSHLDRDLVESARFLLAEHGVQEVYIDWKDLNMPNITSPETAEQLKNHISDSNKFIMLASENAINSRWVPWELGYADSAKGISNIAIFPVKNDYDRDWQRVEYLGIYHVIMITDSNELAVFPPGNTKGWHLKNWMKS